jgi:hypothetical protein
MPYPKEGDPCTTADGRSGYMMSMGDKLVCQAGEDALRVGTAADGETMAEKIARIKGEGDSAEINTAGNTSTTGDTAIRDASDPQRATPDNSASSEKGPTVPGSDGSQGSVKTKSSSTIASQLGEPEAQITDGTKGGERIRATASGRLPESNDVMLGDQSARREGKKDGPTEIDGSKSPHDVTSGGSRQAEGLKQRDLATQDKAAARENPAFSPDAKARTI